MTDTVADDVAAEAQRGVDRRGRDRPPRRRARCTPRSRSNKEYLGRIDAIAGDGDHGIGMSRGSKAAAEAADADRGWRADGAGRGRVRLRRQGRRHQRHPLGPAARRRRQGPRQHRAGDRRAAGRRRSSSRRPNLQSFSKAELGDKTMLDALFPFVDTLSGEVERRGRPGRGLAGGGRRPASRRPRRPPSLTPKIGRARPLAERSVGTPDPGRDLDGPDRHRGR